MWPRRLACSRGEQKSERADIPATQIEDGNWQCRRRGPKDTSRGGCKPLLIGIHLKPQLMDATSFRTRVVLDFCHRGGWKRQTRPRALTRDLSRYTRPISEAFAEGPLPRRSIMNNVTTR